MSSHRFTIRTAHTLIELIAAMITSSILLGGLASVMFIGREVAYAPTSANQRISAATIVNELCDELRWATTILDLTPHSVEFLIADRDYDGAAERFRYAWSGTPGDPLTKTYNEIEEVPVADEVRGFVLAGESTTPEPLIVAGQLIPQTAYHAMTVTLQTGEYAHSRVDASVALLNRPAHLAAHWRLDFEPGQNPTAIDANCDDTPDWNGSFNPANDLSQYGTWQSSSLLESRPAHNFRGVTTVEARFRGHNTGLIIPAYRQNGRYTSLIVALIAQNGAQTLRLQDDSFDMLRETDTNETSEVQNLADDFVRVQVTIVPVHDTVVLDVNGVRIGAFDYEPCSSTSASDRSLAIGALYGAGEFDYVDVRVQPNVAPEN